MRRAHFAAAIAGAFGVAFIEGCAALIGASFDDAGLVVENDAADVREATLHFDVADTKPFDPAALPNLAFWLDAHQSIDVVDASDMVSTWHDLSGHIGRDAVDNSGGGANVPTFAPAGINGEPSVHFESSAYELLATGWTGPESTEFTLFVVTQGYPQSALRFQTAINTDPIIVFPADFAASETAPNFGFEIVNSATDYTLVRATIGAGPTIAAAILRSSGTITTYVNGALVEQRLSATKVLSGAKLFIGGVPFATPATFTHGDIGEVIVYDSALSYTDRSKVEEYLSVKWSIAL